MTASARAARSASKPRTGKVATWGESNSPTRWVSFPESLVVNEMIPEVGEPSTYSPPLRTVGDLDNDGFDELFTGAGGGSIRDGELYFL